MELTKAQRNELFEAVRRGGLDPAFCQLADLSSDHRRGAEITHLPSSSRFTLLTSWYKSAVLRAMTMTNYRLERTLGSDPRSTLEASRWAKVIAEVQSWAKRVADYQQIPDLWASARKVQELITEAQDHGSDNAPFTAGEQARISDQLREIKEYIQSTYELTDEQMARVEEALDTAEQASRRIGRKDWLMAFNGAVFSLFLSDLIPQQAATHIVVMAITGLGHLFGIGGLPPSLPPA